MQILSIYLALGNVPATIPRSSELSETLPILKTKSTGLPTGRSNGELPTFRYVYLPLCHKVGIVRSVSSGIKITIRQRRIREVCPGHRYFTYDFAGCL